MPNLRTPLYDWHVARKARMVPFGGWDMPVQYTGIIDEHAAVRSRAGVFDISHMGRLTLRGVGAETLVQAVWTGDAASMAPGRVRYGLVLNEAGGILDDILVTRFDDHFSLVVNASNRERIVAWLHQHAAGLDVTLVDHTADTAMIAVQGPSASLFAPDWSAGDFHRMKYYTAATRETPDGVEVVSRTGYTGEDGFEYAASPARVLALLDRLTSGANPVRPCGLGARDTLRLEAGMPLYGHELSEQTDPVAAGLSWAVKWDKPDFIGKAALDALEARPDRPVRVGLTLEGRRAARDGAAVLRGGVAIGSVTSGTFSPTLDRPIAMAYVRPDAAQPGTPVEVDIRGTLTPAAVAALPFYKRAK